ncbi:hypothetical protein RUM44_012049 [Polyplax serrata]|uniref:Uncharacterized protein n=1 Tax=Polyplax serrata TaxID=468196 RepID=A0ABR1BE12_POLSC
MVKKATLAPPPLEWDPALKESWHFDLEREPVNDEKWTCVVTAAVPAKLEDDECIRLFSQGVDTRSRRAIKVLSMSHVLEILQQETGDKSQKKTKSEKPSKEGKTSKNTTQMEKSRLRPPPPRSSPIVEFVASYATFTDSECKLPPDLMAALLKHMILTMKDENVFQKKVEAARERKLQEMAVQARFIKSLKPFEVAKRKSTVKGNEQEIKSECINDEPYPGPDLYIVLIDFFNPFYFSELQRMNVPFLAILKISNFLDMTVGKSSLLTTGKPDFLNRKEALIEGFWETLEDNCMTIEKTVEFKNMLFMQYQPQFLRLLEPNQLVRDAIFDELSLMLYNVYTICRQHQMYLQEMLVQRMITCMEPLDLMKCTLYNKLCDALVTGEPNTVFLVVYAMVEQVVAGIIETKNMPLEYVPIRSEYFATNSEADLYFPEDVTDSKTNNVIRMTPCLECRQKVNPLYFCTQVSGDAVAEKGEWFKTTQGDAQSDYQDEMNGEENISHLPENKSFPHEELFVDEILIDQILQEMNRENDDFNLEKSPKCPVVYFYGDRLARYNYHCDSRILNSEAMVARFLKNTDVSQLWFKYPQQTCERRAFYSYHYQRLLDTTKETQESLNIKIFFVLCMKLVGIINSYLYRGEEEVVSEMFRSPSKERPKKLSKVKFEQTEVTVQKRNNRHFSSCFFKLFPLSGITGIRKKVTLRMDNTEKIDKFRRSSNLGDVVSPRKVTSFFSMSLITHRNSGYCYSYCLKAADNSAVKTMSGSAALLPVLDLHEISNMVETHILHSPEDYANLIRNFNFFEALEPNRMIQTLMEAQEAFSTTQCSYFAPTDTLMVILHNDSDHRGVFLHSGYGVLTTPVGLRDFYSHVYQEITDWLELEKDEYMKFVSDIERRKKEYDARRNMKYFKQLKREFKAKTQEQRENFLNQNLEGNQRQEVEIGPEDLEELPIKPKPECPNKVVFVATNLIDLRVETDNTLYEFYSRDGSEIRVTIDSWLYDPNQLLTLSIKQKNFRVVYHHWLGENVSKTFSLNLSSDMLFVFYKGDECLDERYSMKASWPSGLNIETMLKPKTDLYIKQSYIEVYRKKLSVREEKSRSFLRSGQVLIFKEDGKVDVLCASGTRHSLNEFKNDPENDTWTITHYQTTLMSGELRTYNTLTTCPNKRIKSGAIKVYLGVDPKNKETYYVREDGVRCMLWPNGMLVTTFFDGTKITSTPDFDAEEIFVEWTPDEKTYLEQIEYHYKEDKPKSKTILKNMSPDSLPRYSASLCGEETEPRDDGFVQVNVSYLMEHPKYATVYYDVKSPYIEVKMPSHVSLFVDANGTYLVTQGRNCMSIQKDSVELYETCPECGERSIANLYLDSGDILCKFVDLLMTVFYVFRNGETNCEESDKGNGARKYTEDLEVVAKMPHFSCSKNGHTKSISKNQRCFALQRDLSGVEFIHNEALAQYCYSLSPDTFYELHSRSDKESSVTHLFSCPYYTVGHERWTMDYEDGNSSLPTNLKKKDLKELGTKDTGAKLFRYPFARTKKDRDNEKVGSASDVRLPKVVETRIVKCFSQDTKIVMEEMKQYVGKYQKRARDVCKEFRLNRKGDEDAGDTQETLETLINQKWTVFPHLATLVPSTETEIHRAGHYLNLIEELHESEDGSTPRCKQLPKTKYANFPSIDEESESLDET